MRVDVGDWTNEIAAFHDGTVAGILEEVASRRSSSAVFPVAENVFAALRLTPLASVKVVILGQDPYHGPGQAHGLAFSVPQGVAQPPSLRNIMREIREDTGCSGELVPQTDLSRWAAQGVLLLNTVLTVERGLPGSHRNLGWEPVTDQIIGAVSRCCPAVVFLLWGAPAQTKAPLIDTTRHLVLKAPHPSPLSAYRGFFGCHHFTQTNEWLTLHNLSSIDWA